MENESKCYLDQFETNYYIKCLKIKVHYLETLVNIIGLVPGLDFELAQKNQ